LRQQFGLPASFLINHELTLALAAFPDDITHSGEICACPATLFCKQRPILSGELIDKAAQFCLLLVWLKWVDWETDKPAFYKHHLRQYLEIKIQPILAGLSLAARQLIARYLVLIRSNNADFAASVKMSGLLARCIFQELNRDDYAGQEAISHIILLLGELITLADALLDLKQDIQSNQYNPIVSAVKKNHTTLEQEYAKLKADYDLLVQKINVTLYLQHLDTESPLFSEILQQSLHNLEFKIQAAHHALFAESSNNQNNRSSLSKFFEKVGDCFDCIENCGDCVDCCQCCSKGFRCCNSSSEGSGGCCESCNCCDCGGCDCSC
jgi:hypothetical protein